MVIEWSDTSLFYIYYPWYNTIVNVAATPGLRHMETRGQITLRLTTMTTTQIMEYLRYRRKSICSKTIHQKYLTSWLCLVHQGLVRQNCEIKCYRDSVKSDNTYHQNIILPFICQNPLQDFWTCVT